MSAGGASLPELEALPDQNGGGPRVQAPFGRRRCAVSVNEAVGHYRLVGVEDPEGPRPLAGQFYMLAAARGWGAADDGQRPFLPRAFSFCRVRGKRLDFLVDRIGPGTERLAALAPGEEMWLLGPLGVGFSLPTPDGDGSPLLVAGGIGVAPLVAWSEALASARRSARVLLGFRSASWCDAARLFATDARLATDDGSQPPGVEARAGLVTDLLEEELRDAPAAVYACGPPAMLEAVRAICARHSVAGELALEQGMACGFGACFGCVVATRAGYRRLCVDGPVVAAADLAEGWHG